MCKSNLKKEIQSVNNHNIDALHDCGLLLNLFLLSDNRLKIISYFVNFKSKCLNS